jgi:hypothetical protein
MYSTAATTVRSVCGCPRTSDRPRTENIVSSVIQLVCTHVMTAGGYSPGSNAHIAYSKRSAVYSLSQCQAGCSTTAQPNAAYQAGLSLWRNANSVLADRIKNRPAINQRSNVRTKQRAILEERSIFRNVIVSVTVRNNLHMNKCLIYEW